jgi:hypothetical protein
MRWQYRYRLNGKQERLTLGRHPALSLKLARARRDKREILVAPGRRAVQGTARAGRRQRAGDAGARQPDHAPSHTTRSTPR